MLVLNVGDALEVQRARAPHHADDRVALREQELGQVRAVLAGDAGDQCPLCHRGNASRPARRAPRQRLQCRRADGVHGLVPARRRRRGLRRGGQMGRCAGRPRAGHVRTVAGAGPVDRSLPGLAIDAARSHRRGARSTTALAGADLVVVENLCSLPLNPPAAAGGGRGLRRPPRGAASPRPPVAAAAPGPPAAPARRPGMGARHHQRAQPAELADRGISATTIYNAFDPDPAARRPRATPCRPRRATTAHQLLLQPTRALARKNIAGRHRARPRPSAAPIGCSVPAEDGYGPELERLVGRARCPVVLGPPAGRLLHRRCLRRLRRRPAALALGGVRQPVGGVGDPPPPAGHRPLPGGSRAGGLRLPLVRRGRSRAAGALAARSRTTALIAHNHRVAAEHFNLADLPGRLSAGPAPASPACPRVTLR